MLPKGLPLLTDFLKTNLTKFAVIWVKRRWKAGFLGSISTKITLTKEKERRKRKSVRARRKIACERQTFLLAHHRWGTFHEEAFLPPCETSLSGDERGETSAVRKPGGRKARRRRQKTMVVLLVFIYDYFGGSFWSKKKTVGRKRLIWQ